MRQRPGVTLGVADLARARTFVAGTLVGVLVLGACGGGGGAPTDGDTDATTPISRPSGPAPTQNDVETVNAIKQSLGAWATASKAIPPVMIELSQGGITAQERATLKRAATNVGISAQQGVAALDQVKPDDPALATLHDQTIQLYRVTLLVSVAGRDVAAGKDVKANSKVMVKGFGIMMTGAEKIQQGLQEWDVNHGSPAPAASTGVSSPVG